MKLILVFSACLILAIAIAGCTMPSEKPVPGVTPAATNAPVHTGTMSPPVPDASTLLTGRTWSLESIVKNGTTTMLIPGTTITATFGKDGRMNGSAGCNNYFASYNVSGVTITIDKTGSTLMYCGVPAGVMDQESLYLSMLQNASTFSVTEKELNIVDAGGKDTLIYIPYQPPSIAGSWKLDSIANGSTVSQVLAGTNITAVFAPDGNITGSAGCNQYFAGYTTSGDLLNVSAIGTTRMFCAEPAGTMDQESLYLRNLGNATRYMIQGTQLTLRDSSGKATLFYLKG